jgi:2-polyprenyl-3-methyl-5-hydroxy-6-metoxy-1,4-benzoquinol methylase
MNATSEHQFAARDNTDPRELLHYEKAAPTWWDRHGPFWPLRRLNGVRVNPVTRHFALSRVMAVNDMLVARRNQRPC